MADALKPCPFCGGQADLAIYDGESLWSHAIVKWSSVQCSECGATLEDRCDDPDGSQSAEAWNRVSSCTSCNNSPAAPPVAGEGETVTDVGEFLDVHSELAAAIDAFSDTGFACGDWDDRDSGDDDPYEPLAALHEEARVALVREIMALVRASAPRERAEPRACGDTITMSRWTATCDRMAGHGGEHCASRADGSTVSW